MPAHYALAVDIQAHESTAALLSLVSVLHRRAATILSAELAPAADGCHRFSATVRATDRQVATLRASLDNLVEVLGVTIRPTWIDPTAKVPVLVGETRPDR